MGSLPKNRSGLANALFGQVQLRVLNLLFGQPDREFYSSEIIRLAESGSGAVQRELEKLSHAGILETASSGNRKMYKANKQSPIFEELHGLIVKTVGLVEPIQSALKKFQTKIHFAFVYGSIAKGLDTSKSDIDLMVVGEELSYSEIFQALQKAEQKLRRPVSPNLMTAEDWQKKISSQNSFLVKIVNQPKIFVYGNEDGLKRTR